MPDDISNLLGDFIQIRLPIRSAARRVDALPALHEPRARLTAHDVAKVLQMFLADEISSEELGLWADALIVRLGRGVRILAADSDLVLEVVEQLAIVRGLEDDITEAEAAEYLRRLSEVAA